MKTKRIRLPTLNTRLSAMLKYEIEPSNRTLPTKHWVGLMQEFAKHPAGEGLLAAISRLMNGRVTVASLSEQHAMHPTW